MWSRLALGMIVVSGVGLVLTQGRKETTFLGKAITGVVSLYGILGSYGTTSFIGDTLSYSRLSYSRLLALGLTTVIVGQSANMIAGLRGPDPLVGGDRAIGLPGHRGVRAHRQFPDQYPGRVCAFRPVDFCHQVL